VLTFEGREIAEVDAFITRNAEDPAGASSGLFSRRTD
jgi:hypothetical protein